MENNEPKIIITTLGHYLFIAGYTIVDEHVLDDHMVVLQVKDPGICEFTISYDDQELIVEDYNRHYSWHKNFLTGEVDDNWLPTPDDQKLFITIDTFTESTYYAN